MSHGADPNIGNGDGDTPLMYASCHGYTECANLLLEHGANPLVRNFRGVTALIECDREADYPGTRAAIQYYLDHVWFEKGPPTLEQLCVFRLKRMRSSIEEMPISRYVSDYLLDLYFEGWKVDYDEDDVKYCESVKRGR